MVLVEHRIEDVLEAGPSRALYMEEGESRYLGSMEEFLGSPIRLASSCPSARGCAGPALARRAIGSSCRPRPGQGDVPRLEWRHVDAAYDGRAVLHDVSARLDRHERVAVLGPNGSGKTTLFKAAIGLRPLTGGEVLVDGVSSPDRCG